MLSKCSRGRCRNIAIEEHLADDEDELWQKEQGQNHDEYAVDEEEISSCLHALGKGELNVEWLAGEIVAAVNRASELATDLESELVYQFSAHYLCFR